MSEANGVLVTVGRGGWTVYKPNEHDDTGRVTSKGTVSGYADGDWGKYVSPGTPIVDTRTIPTENLLTWSLQSPLVDPDLKGMRGAKVEHDLAGIDKHPDFERIASGLHPTMKGMIAYGNLGYVSVEEYVQLATEWGATVTHQEGE